jgi:hypothetical protein
MKQIGIWIDKREAKIVSFEDGKEHFNIISSGIEDFHPGGGSGTRLKGGPQDVVQDSKYLEREGHQLTEFFKEIVNYIAGVDKMVIFGPADAGRKLNVELSEKHPKIYGKVKSVEKTDSMSENQLKAWVRDYFGSAK